MADLGLYNYIKNALAQGKSKETIEAELAKGRVTPEAAQEAFAAVAHGENPNPYAAQTKKGKGGTIFAILIILIIIIGVAAACYFFIVSPQLKSMQLFPMTAPSTSAAPASSATASSTASTQDPFSEETAIKSDVDTIIAIALNYQDSNGGINGQDIDESCTQALSLTVSAFADPRVQSALKDISKNSSGQQTCKIYNGGDGLAVSAQLVVDTTKWYCHDSDGKADTTAGDTLSSSKGGCQ